MAVPTELLAIFLAGASVCAAAYTGSTALIAWFDNYQEEYVRRAGEDLYGLFSAISPRRVLQWSIGSFAIIFSLSFVVFGRLDSISAFAITFSISICLGLLASLLPKQVLKRLGVLRLRRFDLQLLDAIQSMSNALKAGFSILQAFESIVKEGKNPIAQEFDLFLREIRLGVKFEAASENLGKRVPSEDLQIVLAGIEVTRQTGGNLTEAFDRLAVVIRERMRIQGRIQSLTAQGRLQGWIVGLMPLGLGFAIYMIQPEMILGFVRAPAGIVLIALMLLLEAAGFYLIRKIVTIDV